MMNKQLPPLRNAQIFFYFLRKSDDFPPDSLNVVNYMCKFINVNSVLHSCNKLYLAVIFSIALFILLGSMHQCSWVRLVSNFLRIPLSVFYFLFFIFIFCIKAIVASKPIGECSSLFAWWHDFFFKCLAKLMNNAIEACSFL